MATATLPPGNSGLVCARRLGLVIHQTFPSGKSFSVAPSHFESRMVSKPTTPGLGQWLKKLTWCLFHFAVF